MPTELIYVAALLAVILLLFAFCIDACLEDRDHKRIARRIARKAGILRRIRKLAGDDAARWMNTPNQAFGNQTPGGLLDAGELERLEAALDDLEKGNLH